MTQVSTDLSPPASAASVPPLGARLFGCAGLIPSAAALATVTLGPTDWWNAAFCLDILYAAMILSFLGGAWWGLISGARVSGAFPSKWLVVGVLPPLAAWPLVYFLSPPSLAIISLLFPVCLIADRYLVRHGLAPSWWWTLRWPLSAGMGVLNLAVALAVWPA